MNVQTGTVEDATLYNVFANTDMIEGRGVPVLIGVFLNSVSAKRWAEGRGVYGGNAEVREERALAKLTAAEREALGVK